MCNGPNEHCHWHCHCHCANTAGDAARQHISTYDKDSNGASLACSQGTMPPPCPRLALPAPLHPLPAHTAQGAARPPHAHALPSAPRERQAVQAELLLCCHVTRHACHVFLRFTAPCPLAPRPTPAPPRWAGDHRARVPRCTSPAPPCPSLLASRGRLWRLTPLAARFPRPLQTRSAFVGLCPIERLELTL